MPTYTSGSEEGLLPEGDYDFVVDDAGEKESSNGNPMIELQLLIEHNGVKARVFDQLVFTKNATWKIDHFRASIGETLIKGQEVTLEAEDCVDRRGCCHLFVDEYQGRKRNKVHDYLPPSTDSTDKEPADINF
jgi:Protein of unknown function (DUF669)